MYFCTRNPNLWSKISKNGGIADQRALERAFWRFLTFFDAFWRFLVVFWAETDILRQLDSPCMYFDPRKTMVRWSITKKGVSRSNGPWNKHFHVFAHIFCQFWPAFVYICWDSHNTSHRKINTQTIREKHNMLHSLLKWNSFYGPVLSISAYSLAHFGIFSGYKGLKKGN